MAFSFDPKLIDTKISKAYLKEYVGESPLSPFMGSSPNRVIQLFEMDSGEGLSFRIGFRKDLNYQNPIIGFDQAAGSEQPIQFFEDEIKVKLRRFVDILMGVPLVKLATPIAIFETLRPALLTTQRRNLVKSIFDAACAPSNTPNDPGLYNAADGGTGPLVDRVIYAAANGGGAASYQASIFAGVGGMGAATPAASGMSVMHIRNLKSYAVNGGIAYERESRIMPYESKAKKSFPEEHYVLFIDPNSYRSLAADPLWNQLMYRGVIQNADQPEALSGARYRGMIEGVLVYECPELARYRVVSGGVTAAWNLFVGAQAFGICWAKHPWFEMESRDFNMNVAMAVSEMRGQKVFMFPSFQDPAALVERGMIHSFTRLT